MVLPSFDFFLNAAVARRNDFPFHTYLPNEGAAAALAEIAKCPHYAPTPLRFLPKAADRAGVASVAYKDESQRFSLRSFKALGGTYAVALFLKGRLELELGRPVSVDEIVNGRHLDRTSEWTVACASDGNHGRAVAAGAKIFRCKCTIFLHEGVSERRAFAIRSLGATVIRTPGNYDESVVLAFEAASRNGWKLISDTAQDETGIETPLQVMQGYRVLVTEALNQLEQDGRPPPTHVFLQGGVGGLAAAVVAHMHQLSNNLLPVFIVVEPERADCLFRSALHGQPTPAVGDLNTVMAGLACGEVSLAAWPILAAGTDAFMTIPDRSAVDIMRELADGTLADSPIVAGESAVAGLAALMMLSGAGGEKYRSYAGLGPKSQVLVIGTEGATDPVLYRELVGDPLADHVLGDSYE